MDDWRLLFGAEMRARYGELPPPLVNRAKAELFDELMVGLAEVSPETRHLVVQLVRDAGARLNQRKRQR